MPQPEYNLALVALSFIIATYGSYTALNLAIRIPTAPAGASLMGWLSTSAIAIGGGIWSMHFIGMLAYNMHMPVTYELGLTLASLLLAVVVCGLGLFIVGRGQANLIRLLCGGLITGSGVAGMHYTGMDAMQMEASMSYNMPIFYLSLAIAIGAATAALWLAFNMRGHLQQIGSALVMGIAVCGMHYTGMAAMEFSMLDGAVQSNVGSASVRTSLIIFVVASIIFTALLTLALRKSAKKELVFE